MKKIIVFLVLNVLFILSVQLVYSQDGNIEGTWSIDKVKIENKLDGNITISEYSTNDTINSFVPCPLRVIITPEKIVFEYSNRTQKAGRYSIDGNKLKVSTDVALFEYQYELYDSDKIRIIYEAHYILDGVYNVEEIYTFYGEKE